jgi:hypothetical protein
LLESPPAISPFKTSLSTFLSLLVEADPTILVERVALPAELGEGEMLFTRLPTANWLQLVGFAAQRAKAPGAQDGWAELNKEYRRLGKPLLKEPAVKAVRSHSFPSDSRDRTRADTMASAASKAVAAIGQQTFGIAPPKGAGGNGLMDLMGSLFG